MPKEQRTAQELARLIEVCVGTPLRCSVVPHRIFGWDYGASVTPPNIRPNAVSDCVKQLRERYDLKRD